MGGFEIGGIAGLILGAAECRIPVVIDGVISVAGAMIAWLLEPRVDGAACSPRTIRWSRRSRQCSTRMGLEPILDLGHAAGEGTGCALAMPIIEAGVKVIREMATFAEAGVSTG